MGMEANETQKAMICSHMGKEMMRCCYPPALERSAEVKVPAPPEIANLRKDVESLRQNAKDCKAQMTEATKAEPAAAPSGGGMLGGMMASAQNLANQATAAVGGAAGDVMEDAINKMADSLEKVVNTIEEPFVTIGKDVVEAKKDKFKSIWDLHITNCPLAGAGDAIPLCRGKADDRGFHGKKEYDAVPPDALSDYLCRKSAKNLITQMSPVCEEAIKDHAITKAWDTSIGTYNDMVSKVDGIDFLKKNGFTLKKIELDLKEYITAQCVEQLAKLMGEEEAKFRKAPATSGRGKDASPPWGEWKTKAFDTCFSGDMISDKLCTRYVNEVGTPK